MHVTPTYIAILPDGKKVFVELTHAQLYGGENSLVEVTEDDGSGEVKVYQTNLSNRGFCMIGIMVLPPTEIEFS